MLKLRDGQKEALLRRARQSIAAVFDPGVALEPLDDSVFREKSGLFVTLTVESGLRGCIGFITGVEPLKEAVVTLAREAAFHDPRFPPLQRSSSKYPSFPPSRVLQTRTGSAPGITAW